MDFWGPGGATAGAAKQAQAPARQPSPSSMQDNDEAAGGNAFGAAVPSDIMSWCVSELQRIGGRNDFTNIVSFVYNLHVRTPTVLGPAIVK
jgi:hypothetical protein